MRRQMHRMKSYVLGMFKKATVPAPVFHQHELSLSKPEPKRESNKIGRPGFWIDRNGKRSKTAKFVKTHC